MYYSIIIPLVGVNILLLLLLLHSDQLFTLSNFFRRTFWIHVLAPCWHRTNTTREERCCCCCCCCIYYYIIIPLVSSYYYYYYIIISLVSSLSSSPCPSSTRIGGSYSCTCTMQTLYQHYRLIMLRCCLLFLLFYHYSPCIFFFSFCSFFSLSFSYIPYISGIGRGSDIGSLPLQVSAAERHDYDGGGGGDGIVSVSVSVSVVVAVYCCLSEEWLFFLNKGPKN